MACPESCHILEPLASRAVLSFPPSLASHLLGPSDPSGSVILTHSPGCLIPWDVSPGFLAALPVAVAPRKGLQLSSSERLRLLCSVQCIFHTLSFPAGRGLETLQAVGYCLSPSPLVCLLAFLGCHFCWISLFFLNLFHLSQIALSHQIPSPAADNGGLSIAKCLPSCSRGRAFMASNFLAGAAEGAWGLAGAGSRRTLCHGLPPLQRLSLSPLSICKLSCWTAAGSAVAVPPSRKPPASLCPPPRAPRGCAICSQLAAACQRLGRAGGSCLCPPWL